MLRQHVRKPEIDMHCNDLWSVLTANVGTSVNQM